MEKVCLNYLERLNYLKLYDMWILIKNNNFMLREMILSGGVLWSIFKVKIEMLFDLKKGLNLVFLFLWEFEVNSVELIVLWCLYLMWLFYN